MIQSNKAAIQAWIPTIAGVIIVILIGGGILAWQYFWVPKEVKAPEEKAPEEIVEDETANWKTYRNEEYGYEIKYPPIDWKVKDEFDGSSGVFLFFREANEEDVIFCFFIGCPAPAISIVFQSYDNVESFWLWEIIEEKPERKPPLEGAFEKELKKEVVFIGNRKITKVDATDPASPGWQSWYYVFDSPKIESLIIFHYYTNEKEPISYEFIVEQMLSTFRFLE